MTAYYDDNFGWWDEEDEEFYHEVQERSVEKECVICGRLVRILPHYDKCDACTTAIENGWAY